VKDESKKELERFSTLFLGLRGMQDVCGDNAEADRWVKELVRLANQTDVIAKDMATTMQQNPDDQSFIVEEIGRETLRFKETVTDKLITISSNLGLIPDIVSSGFGHLQLRLYDKMSRWVDVPVIPDIDIEN
jgi:hypothetical protein